MGHFEFYSNSHRVPERLGQSTSYHIVEWIQRPTAKKTRDAYLWGFSPKPLLTIWLAKSQHWYRLSSCAMESQPWTSYTVILFVMIYHLNPKQELPRSLLKKIKSQEPIVTMVTRYPGLLFPSPQRSKVKYLHSAGSLTPIHTGALPITVPCSCSETSFSVCLRVLTSSSPDSCCLCLPCDSWEQTSLVFHNLRELIWGRTGSQGSHGDMREDRSPHPRVWPKPLTEYKARTLEAVSAGKAANAEITLFSYIDSLC